MSLALAGLPVTGLAAVASGRTPSSVVISNLAYLAGAIVLAVVITTVVAIRHNRPRSTEDDMDDFHRGLAALNPDRGQAPNHDRGQRRSPAMTRSTAPGSEAAARPSLRPQRLPFEADGSAPRRQSTRSKSG